jgi:HK97 family phage prohead protease
VSDIEYGPRFRLTEFKSSDTGAEVAGYVSTYGNVDHGGDVVMRGAFDSTLAAQTPVRFLWAHDTHEVIGLPLELKTDDTGLFGRFKISQTQRGRDVHTLLKDGAVDSFSIGYIPTQVEFDDAGTRLLKSVDLLECSVVAMPMNERATVTAVKSDDHDDEEAKATWSGSYVNDLPDSAFAVVLPGGSKDKAGKTVPRNLRKLPHHDANGKVDLPHLRNALSREPQSDMPDAAHSRARGHLNRHAKTEGVGGGNGKKVAEWIGELDEDCPFEDLLAQVGGYATIAAEAAEALQARRVDEERKLSGTHIDAIHDLLDVLEGAAERLEQIASPPSPPDEGMKTRLELANALRRGERFLSLETA